MHYNKHSITISNHYIQVLELKGCDVRHALLTAVVPHSDRLMY